MSTPLTRKLSTKKIKQNVGDARRSMDMGRIRDSIDVSRTDDFTIPENYLLIRLQGWRVMLKALGSHFTSMANHERSIASGMDRASSAPRMPESDNRLAFISDSFANTLMGALGDSQKEMSISHNAIAEAYSTKIIEPLREIKGQVKALYREFCTERTVVEKERSKDSAEIKALHSSLTKSLQYFSVNKGILNIVMSFSCKNARNR
jgi:hypothetical protein